MVTYPPTHTHTHTHTYRQDRLQYTAPQIARSVLTIRRRCLIRVFIGLFVFLLVNIFGPLISLNQSLHHCDILFVALVKIFRHMFGTALNSAQSTHPLTSGVQDLKHAHVYMRYINLQRQRKQEAQLMLTYPPDAVRGQSRSPNIVSSVPYMSKKSFKGKLKMYLLSKW